MKTQTVHLTDKMLRDSVISQLDFEPEVNPAGIGVAVEQGVVTLSGFVDDYAQKAAAEKAVKRLFGVKGLANELLVRRRNVHRLTFGKQVGGRTGRESTRARPVVFP